ncbi:hypothetical protein CC86DRAFT_78935 [Ophiobolus disseminans]|uniref:Uncharacterized protein n=1 Tax=Ophiobolus disseminans TaxID=1469910 RepID=A0A6A6ZNK1_9PLEO|nr:hypothetical protein CC86DRAFT_78935 [Ophiobolus disseminans]
MFPVSARRRGGSGLSLFPGSPNTAKPLASSSLRHVALCDAPSFETGSVAPRTAAKLMRPAPDHQDGGDQIVFKLTSHPLPA